ncbi:matrixin family metalloprotease [Paremcibacter congregatus]|uniref:matrixin family metalloprotease n=1 Tax=Paremcibacter congregatus TaxID=2043170 RepID=UPI003A928805
MTYAADRTNFHNNQKQAHQNTKKRSLTRGGLIGLALLPLSACGGGGGGSSPTGGTVTPPPPPTPDFTESPTNTFTARDDNDRTLDQGSSSSGLTVTGKAGNDTITTGSGADVILGGAGNDTITSGAGADMVRGGEGADTINAGGGDDVIVVVGTTTANQYDAASITNPAGSGVDLSSLITLADLNGRTVSEVATGEVVDGGAGNNTLYIYGTVDLTGVTLTNVTQLIVNSDVTLTAEQIAQFTTIDGDGNSVINIAVPEGSGEVILDLSGMNLSDIGSLNIAGDITVKVNSLDDVAGIMQITVNDTGSLKLAIASDSQSSISLDGIAAVFGQVDVIDLGDQVTLNVETAQSVADLGLAEISGAGGMSTDNSSETLSMLNNLDIGEEVSIAWALFESFSLSAQEYVRGEGAPTLEFDFGGREATITVRLVGSSDGVYNPLIESFTGSRGAFILPEFYRKEYDTSDVRTIYIESITIQEQDGSVFSLNYAALRDLGIENTITVNNNPNDDHTPPVLESFSIDESELNDFGHPKFSYKVSDDKSGIAIVDIEIADEFGNSYSFGSTLDEAIYLTPYIAPNFSNQGLSPWTSGKFTITNISVIDGSAINGNRQSYSTEKLEELGFQTTFEINNPILPEGAISSMKINGLDLSSTIVDLSTPEETYLTINADGVLIGSSVTIRNIDTSEVLFVSTRTGSIDLEQLDDLTAGTWEVIRIFAMDIFYGTIRLDEAEISQREIGLQFEVMGEKPVVPQTDELPEIVSFSIKDNIINMDEGEVYIEANLSTTPGTDPGNPYARYADAEGHYISISFSNGVGLQVLYPYVVEGTYNFVDFRLQNNDVTYTADDLGHIDFPSEITIINSLLQDNVTPELISFDFVDEYVDMNADEKLITISYEFSDNVSGVLISLRGPNGEKFHTGGNAQKGVVTLKLPENATSGTYTVFQVRTYDYAGNFSQYLTKDQDYSDYDFSDFTGYLEDLGFESTFTVQNDFAVIVPDFNIVEFSLQDQIADLRNGNSGIKFDISADVSFGQINGILVKYIDPSGSLHSEYVNGSQGSVSLNLDVLHSPSGDYSLYEISVFDHKGNKQVFDKDSMEAKFGAEAVSFNVVNDALPELELGTNTFQTYLPVKTIAPTGDILKDALLNDTQYELPDDGSPLIITYSFANPENSIFSQVGNYYGGVDVDFEESQFLVQFDGNEQNTVRAIFDNIESFANIIFVEIEDNGESSAGHLRFAWTKGEMDPSSFWKDTAAGWSFHPTGSAQAGDIWLSENSFRDSAQGDETHLILKQTLMHEIGHALGLKHPHQEQGGFGILPEGVDGRDYSLMSYNAFSHDDGYGSWYGGPQSYMSLDINALHYLYGINDNATAGDDIYSINGSNLNLFTLWDFDGNDTLDVSNINFLGSHTVISNVAINLTPGTWSDLSVYYQQEVDYSKATDNRDHFFIAENTIIENLITGNGNDILIGNEENNRLEANDGDDYLNGGDGIDTLLGGRGDDVLVYTSGDVFDGGGGEDTLLVGNSDLSLDLTSINLTNIEIIDVSGSGDHSLTLSLQDILNASDQDNQIVIKGDVGDSVVSTSQDWVLGTDQEINGEKYHTYTSGEATLLIDTDITQDIT